MGQTADVVSRSLTEGEAGEGKQEKENQKKGDREYSR